MKMSAKYFQSFHVDDHENYVKFFNDNGFAVIDNILSEEECTNSIEEIWNYLEEKGNGVDRNNPQSWDGWPAEVCKNGGFMGTFPYWKKMKDSEALKERHISTQCMAWKNRENPLLYKAFSHILNTPKLWVSVDRYGIMRPTKLKINNINNNTNSGQAVDDKFKIMLKDDWKTKENWLHWDLSPFHFGTSAAGFAPARVHYKELAKAYGGLRVQGLITLTDGIEDRGGFHCVPKFVNDRFFEWAEKNKEYGELPEIKTRNFIEVPEDDPMRSEMTRIPMRAGSVLIWNSQLPHGNFPNTSSDFRMVQYIKMIPVDEPREFKPALLCGKVSPKDFFPENFEPSELGRKLFGIEPWDNQQNTDNTNETESS
eukprot:TRINITY_DN7210_c0_g1_i1.p1 TRINITY_DN7210_c0_g1~~TRINITY_DN7210_c0_g1_i1.p1  ORF type:complete len:369 (-),score=82.34 TRINITY_DN7210_c0_g1_i1:26-1132(-)